MGLEELAKTEPSRQEKAVELAEEIHLLNNTKGKAKMLLDRIHGTPVSIEPVPDASSATPTLYQVLTDGPEGIRRLRDEIEEILSQIEHSIF